MLTIDGSQGEGGGQILRTSVALSAVTEIPVRVINIRANRPKPGLRAQHLNAIKAVAEVCKAETHGVEIGSREIEFLPKKLSGGTFDINIGTAGSITLVLQALMIPAVHAKERLAVRITGGTDMKWSPPIDYLRFVTLPLLKKFGYQAEIQLIRRGYYPSGGGEVVFKVTPSSLEKIFITDRGKILNIKGISHAHPDLRKAEVAERQAKSARILIRNELNKEAEIEKQYAHTFSYGSGITLWAETENSILGADSIGERGKRAEVVGEEAAGAFVAELNTGAGLDKHMADQVVPFLALAGGRVAVSEVTEHTRTNIHVLKKFGYDLKVEGNVISKKS